ncbi:MAG TPA: ribbon-helix-helix protein, CopG family [Thermoleophilaceae bacterium]|nr:ribbon-helix-helix protein, CopG family [Thermoleophilaceae bacterium]
MRRQVLVQFTPDLLARLDERSSELSRSRSELVREAVEHYLTDDREALLTREILDGYTRLPQADDDLARLAEWNARRTILEEPW